MAALRSSLSRILQSPNSELAHSQDSSVNSLDIGDYSVSTKVKPGSQSSGLVSAWPAVRLNRVANVRLAHLLARCKFCGELEQSGNHQTQSLLGERGLTAPLEFHPCDQR